jgi:hypothetical protein
MAAFVRLVRPPAQARILDLGGTPDLWTRFPNDFRITMVNLKAPADAVPTKQLEFVEGDATDLGRLFADRTFDVVFSNSVIEHVGGATKRAAFVREVKRHAPAYWVQTPSQYFPIEPHSGVPFFFQLPSTLRDKKIAKWAETMPEWTDMIRGTVSVPRREMAALFDGDPHYIERVFGIAKSVSFYRDFIEALPGTTTKPVRRALARWP